MNVLEYLKNVLIDNGLITAFVVIGLVTLIAQLISKYLTHGRIHGSAIAILIGLILAYLGGVVTGGQKGLSDIPIFSGIGLLGGSMFRDFTIISTSFGAKLSEVRKCGLLAILSPVIGVLTSFAAGLIIALAFGYSDVVSVVTISAGAVTFIVGSVTGAALGASSAVIAIAIGAGVIKSIAIMVFTPFLAKKIGLTTPRSAMLFGGLMGSTSGVASGLAATDPALVPYGAMTATFYAGVGCLLCPSVLFFLVRLFF